MRMFETEFDPFAKNPQLDLYPSGLHAEIDELNAFIYETFNNGVYRAGRTLEVYVTKAKAIGKYTKITFRKGKAPQRVDRCLWPDSTKPKACPLLPSPLT